ncbi:MAG: HRDC domain-containing protein [Ardenticatenaceae bacterium]|nr:HRDC domain-containing protein [Anaerolineales bacterium]MCB8938205.1 HRDC domain-containing protein [Ardenticatenaceae bacterium]MCB8975771.1 HRDC domain-containing protein [Ardenticatenaceae bacterium]
MKLPPHKLITTQSDWQLCLEKLHAEPRLAIDLEANSMYAYREEVCLIQITIPGQDYIIDPLGVRDVTGLGEIIQDPQVEKVFHAAEYDMILLKRQFDWQLHNLFDTMWAARILGYERYGLASMIETVYGIELDKRHQKSNWCKRPLSPEQLVYAQLDTHHLLDLRDHLEKELQTAGRLEEAAETFAEQTHVKLSNNEFDPDNDFWSISGAYDLTRQQQAVLRALAIYRNHEARQRNRPLFKVFHDKTLIELAQTTPTSIPALRDIHGMSAGQTRRYGRQLLNTIAEGLRAPNPPFPKRPERLPDDVANRFDKLHTWRKNSANARGVESDVIISKDALWAIALKNPKTEAEISQLNEIGSWRCKTYAKDILAVLRNN